MIWIVDFDLWNIFIIQGNGDNNNVLDYRLGVFCIMIEHYHENFLQEYESQTKSLPQQYLSTRM